MEGDTIRLSGGTKTLKKLFVDSKIPAAQRSEIPVLADGNGILAVYSVGADENRKVKELPAWQISITKNRNTEFWREPNG
jgi:tRNA(Ile)-lysidine synthetase-like protein